MLIGYMRVFTAEQNLALQHDALLAAGGWHRARTHLRRHLLGHRNQPSQISPRPGAVYEAF